MAYQIEVLRTGAQSGIFKAPRYNDASGKPIINDDIQDSGSRNVYRPSKLKQSGVPSSSSRGESLLGFNENRKVFLNNSFSVDVPGAPIPVGNFTRVSGLEIEWELETYREGGENGGEHVFPSQIKNSRLVCEYGIGFLDPLYRWFSMTNAGMMIRLPMLIYLMDEKRFPVKLWMVMSAMPVKYSAPSFDAMASEVAITRLEFIHSGLINIL